MCELGMRLRSVSRRHGEVLQSDTIVTPVPLNRLLRLLLKPTSLSPTAGPAPIAPIVARDAVKASGGGGVYCSSMCERSLHFSDIFRTQEFHVLAVFREHDELHLVHRAGLHTAPLIGSVRSL